MTSGSGSSTHDPHLTVWSFAFSLVLALTACTQSPVPTPPSPEATSKLVLSTTFPAATPTRTPLPDLKAALGPPIFQDTFTSDTGWETGATGRGAISLFDGRLVVAVQGPGVTLASASPAPATSDFFVEVEVLSEICEAGDEFGLMVRTLGSGSPTQDSHYRFLITCDGAVRASRFLSGAEAALVPISSSPAVIPGAPTVNRLAVSSRGDEFEFYVNDITVFRTKDGEIPEGGISVIVRARHAAQTTVSFDDFRLWDRTAASFDSDGD